MLLKNLGIVIGSGCPQSNTVTSFNGAGNSTFSYPSPAGTSTIFPPRKLGTFPATAYITCITTARPSESAAPPAQLTLHLMGLSLSNLS